MTFDTASNSVLLFGGHTNTKLLNDTWLWNGITWTQPQSATSPPARMYHAFAHDPVRKETVLFGGTSSSLNSWQNLLGDTWVWNGSTWIKKTPATSPTPRQDHVMAWDPVGKRVILFGGNVNAGSGYLPNGETWAWDGVNWERLTLANSPPAASIGNSNRAATDPVRSQIVLRVHGIQSFSTAATWIFDGVTWKEAQAPLMSPGSRYEPYAGEALVWDGNAERIVSSNVLSWVWTGAEWRELAVAGTPLPSGGFAAAWDAARKQVVGFGGRDPTHDTWMFDYGKGCVFLDPPARIPDFPAAGGAYELNVPIAPGCSWSVINNAPWLTVTQQAGPAGTPVRLQSAPNSGWMFRSASLTVAGRIYGVTQAQAPCPSAGPLITDPLPLRKECVGEYMFNATAGDQIAFQSVAPGGTNFGLYSTLTLTSPSNTQIASAGPSLVTALPPSGVLTLPQTGTYSLRATPSVVLSANGAVSLRFVRSGEPCKVDVLGQDIQPLTTRALSDYGGSYVVRVGVRPGCSASITSSQPWLTPSVTSLSSGFTNVTLTYPANAGQRRTAVLMVGSSTFTFTQDSSACTFDLEREAGTPVAGLSTATVRVTPSAPDCAWQASSDASWIQPYPLAGTGSGQITYTVFPNVSGSTRTGKLTIAGKDLFVQQWPSGLTSAERYIQLLYFSFFGRMPAPAEIAFQAASGQTRQQLALNFLHSTEFNPAGRFVAGLYVGILDRDAEYGGWLFQRNALAGGVVDQEALVRNFIGSVEFTGRHPSLNNGAFVTLMYKQVLLRDPTAAEVAFQAGALGAGLSRVQLARNFLNSAEFRQGTSARLTAFLLYATLLQRDPAAQEFATAATGIGALDALGDATARQNAVRDQFLASMVNGTEMNAVLR